jgi:hypothetical protein
MPIRAQSPLTACLLCGCTLQVGITDAQAMTVVEGLEVSGSKEAAVEQIKGLYNLFAESDCTMVEVNPLAEDDQGTLIAADAKVGCDDNAAFRHPIASHLIPSHAIPSQVGFDDNASFRQADIFAQRNYDQEDPREVAADKWDLNYVGLDGNIGCMVNGAGLAMATMDIIAAYGGEVRPPRPPPRSPLYTPSLGPYTWQLYSAHHPKFLMTRGSRPTSSTWAARPRRSRSPPPSRSSPGISEAPRPDLT